MVEEQEVKMDILEDVLNNVLSNVDESTKVNFKKELYLAYPDFDNGDNISKRLIISHLLTSLLLKLKYIFKDIDITTNVALLGHSINNDVWLTNIKDESLPMYEKQLKRED